MMENIINELTRCLDDEIRIYKKILSLVTEEREILVRNEELKLEEIVGRQNELIKEINLYENKRAGLLKQLAGKDKRSKSLRGRIDKMKSLISGINEINNNNISLIEQGSSSIREFLRLIIGNNGKNSYSRNGKVKISSSGSILLNKKI